ncbi:hypothetical protein [Streptomyces californicus]|uniref:hypothetical protein n=1 Tax=Streptomyces californicus TaxID=67351 RepID=UPI0037FB1940
MARGIDAWVRWNDAGRVTYAVDPPCGTEDPTAEGMGREACFCWLPTGHPLAHSWEIADHG